MATTLAADVAPAYPGGPSHRAGAEVTELAVIKDSAGREIGFTAPSATALALSIATRASVAAERLWQELPFTSAIGPGGSMAMLGTGQRVRLFDYFEHCFVSAVFSIQALEAFSNRTIGRRLGERTYQWTRRNELAMLTADELEREVQIDAKLGVILPDLLGKPSPKGGPLWEPYKSLRQLRDRTVHLKSPHQHSTTISDAFESSPYASFAQAPARHLVIPALRILDYFATVANERTWIAGAWEQLGVAPTGEGPGHHPSAEPPSPQSASASEHTDLP